MNIEFLPAKNGELTAKSDSFFFHSSYSPVNEAKRFVENLSFTFSPTLIILCEPGLNYIYNFIRQKFPDTKIGIIHFTNKFNEYNFDCDFILNFTEISDFGEYLINFLGEEQLFSTAFVSWAPSAKIFHDEEKKLSIEIKKALEKSKTLLVTREYFEKKWFLNSIKFVSTVKNTYILKNKINLPVVIIASGPSLQSKINFLKDNQDKFFVICLSSAISCLIHNNIIPDLCISTDGGYWAGQHLKKLNKNIPLALSSESFASYSILKNDFIVPLAYSDGISKEIFDFSSINYKLAQRNGTVSGTALDFALDFSSNDIYFFGLDLASGKGPQHSKPNEIEINNELFDNRLKTKEKRNCNSMFNSSSLQIYENWFINKKTSGRNVFRVIEENKKHNKFNYIEDISLDVFSKKCEFLKNNKKNSENFFEKSKISLDTNLYNFVCDLLQKEETLKQLFPLDYVSLSHNNSDSSIIFERISEKKNKLLQKIRKYLNVNQ